MKKHKLILFIALTTLSLLILAVFYVKNQLTGTTGSIETLETFADYGYVVNGKQPYVMSSDYLVVGNYNFQQGRSHYTSKEALSWSDYAKADFYKTSNEKELYKTLDLLAIIQEDNEDYLPSGVINAVVVDSKTKEAYLQVPVYYMPDNSPGGVHFSLHTAFINIETESVILSKKEHRLDKKGLPSNLEQPQTFKEHFYYTDVTDVGNKLLKEPAANDKQTEIYIFQEKTDLSKTRLAKKFPEATKLLEKGNAFYWKNKDKELAQLLAQEGETDVFQGVTLYGKYSKDGKDHVVQSYDELMTWYQEPAEEEDSE